MHTMKNFFTLGQLIWQVTDEISLNDLQMIINAICTNEKLVAY